MKGYPNRITRQARILPSILKSYIPDIENLNLFVRGINTGGLENREAREKARQHRDDRGGGRGTMRHCTRGLRQVLASRRFRLQPIHKAHNRETLSDTEQLAATGPSPHRLHHLDMHAIRRMEKSTHRDPFSWPLCCFGLRDGFPKA